VEEKRNILRFEVYGLCGGENFDFSLLEYEAM
jgi:hypothetical protein